MTASAAAGTSTSNRWHLGRRTITIDKPVILGIVNVTPDSFSDGGNSFSPQHAIARAVQLLGEGADIVDVGGESTRPGAAPVSEDEEIRRVLPVTEGVLRALPDAVLSVDTVKAGVAQRALDAGAAIVNDVSGFRLDPALPGVCANAGCGVILMHSRGDVREMALYALATYGDDPVSDVVNELRAAADRATSAGVATESIVLDPGFGFSKTSEHSLAVLRQLNRLCALGFPVMVGLSRKRMIGELSGVSAPADRDAASVGAAVMALTQGAHLFRVHEVAMHRQALDAAWAILNAA